MRKKAKVWLFLVLCGLLALVWFGPGREPVELKNSGQFTDLRR